MTTTQLKFDYDEATGAIIADKDGLHIHTTIGEDTAWLFTPGSVPIEDIELFIKQNEESIENTCIFAVREDGTRRILIKLVPERNIFEFMGLSLLMNIPR
jgi:hypothetical protein